VSDVRRALQPAAALPSPSTVRDLAACRHALRVECCSLLACCDAGSGFLVGKVVVVQDMRWLLHEICRFVLIHGVGCRALVEVNPNLGFFPFVCVVEHSRANEMLLCFFMLVHESRYLFHFSLIVILKSMGQY
jgi:hypothetical protein